MSRCGGFRGARRALADRPDGAARGAAGVQPEALQQVMRPQPRTHGSPLHTEPGRALPPLHLELHPHLSSRGSSRIKQQKWDTASQGGQPIPANQSADQPITANKSTSQPIRKHHGISQSVTRQHNRQTCIPTRSSANPDGVCQPNNSQSVTTTARPLPPPAASPPTQARAGPPKEPQTATGATGQSPVQPGTEAEPLIQSQADTEWLSQSGSSSKEIEEPPTAPQTTGQASLPAANPPAANQQPPLQPAPEAPGLAPGRPLSGGLSAIQRPLNASQLTRQAKEFLRSPRRRTGEPCELACLNGGQCSGSSSCDCSLYQATGHRCQTVPNPGFEREMACRTWGQYNFETFDGLYYYFPGRCTYTLLRDCEDAAQASITVQVSLDNLSPIVCRPAGSFLFSPLDSAGLGFHRAQSQPEEKICSED
ncbi:unnamed protein product [Menidia menidia]|uniref:(Atlantic silverside) hypothetical protein n=1 Tax=Menidia menidia TaxID=238744 RepID=A0A8S4A9U1_9TELE|nr:unnamed protein product [Menidia menidia]